jgi:hypothetical protein
MFTFSTDLATAFLGVIAALFVGTLVIKTFTDGTGGKGLLFLHFSNFVLAGGAMVIVIAFGDAFDPGLQGSIGLWVISLVSILGFLAMLFRDLWTRKITLPPTPAAGAATPTATPPQPVS